MSASAVCKECQSTRMQIYANLTQLLSDFLIQLQQTLFDNDSFCHIKHSINNVNHQTMASDHIKENDSTNIFLSGDLHDYAAVFFPEDNNIAEIQPQKHQSSINGVGGVSSFFSFSDNSTSMIAEMGEVDKFVVGGCSTSSATTNSAGGSPGRRQQQRGRRLFQCKMCPKVLTSHYHLVSHLSRHSGDRPHACSLCQKSFKSPLDLTQHQLLVHRHHRPFKCDLCEKSFDRKANYNYHQNTHTGNRPYTCKACGCAFGSLPGLSQHRKRCSLLQKSRIAAATVSASQSLTAT